MAYAKTTWANNQAPAISSSNLNNIENGIKNIENNVNNGWIPLTGTLTFVSFDSNTGIGVVGSNIDLTPYIGVGMKAKFTQNNAIKYAVITAITSTQITFFLGTSYSLNNSAITNTYFSMLKSPYGLPLEMVNDEYILYNDATGVQGNVTTSLYASTFSSYDINIQKVGVYNSAHIEKPQGRTVTLLWSNPYGAGLTQFLFETLAINNATMTREYYNFVNFDNATIPAGGVSLVGTNIYVYQVIGHLFKK